MLLGQALVRKHPAVAVLVGVLLVVLVIAGFVYLIRDTRKTAAGARRVLERLTALHPGLRLRVRDRWLGMADASGRVNGVVVRVGLGEDAETGDTVVNVQAFSRHRAPDGFLLRARRPSQRNDMPTGWPLPPEVALPRGLGPLYECRASSPEQTAALFHDVDAWHSVAGAFDSGFALVAGHVFLGRRGEARSPSDVSAEELAVLVGQATTIIEVYERATAPYQQAYPPLHDATLERIEAAEPETPGPL